MKLIHYILPLLIVVTFAQPVKPQLNKAYFYLKAEKLIAKNRFAEALPYINTLIQADSTLIEGWFLRGIARYNLGDLYGADTDFSHALSIHPFFTPALHFHAITQSDLLHYTEAIHSIKQAIKLKPNSSDYYYTLGAIYLQKSDYQPAIRAFSGAIRLNNRNRMAWLYRGVARLQTTDTLGALSDYNFALRLSPKYVEAFLRRGLLNAELKKFTLAFADINRAVKLDSLNPTLYFNRAIIAYNANQPKRALSDLNRAIELKPDYPLARFNRAVIHLQTHNQTEALTDLTELTKLTPNNILVYYYRALLFMETNKPSRALQDLNFAIKLFPDFAQAYLIRARVKQKMGLNSASEADYIKAKALSERYSSENSSLQNLLDSTGKLRKLISLERHFDFASRIPAGSFSLSTLSIFKSILIPVLTPTDPLAPESQPLFTSVKPVFTSLPSKTELYFAPAVLTDTLLLRNLTDTPNSLAPSVKHFIKGLYSSRKNRYLEAESHFKAALKIIPNNPIVRAALIINQVDMLRFIEETIQGSMSQRVTLNNESTSQSRTIEEYTKAQSELKALIKHFPSSGIIEYNIATLSLFQSDFKGAIHWYNLALGKNPKLVYARYNRGLARLITGDSLSGCSDLTESGEQGMPEAFETLKKFCKR